MRLEPGFLLQPLAALTKFSRAWRLGLYAFTVTAMIVGSGTWAVLNEQQQRQIEKNVIDDGQAKLRSLITPKLGALQTKIIESAAKGIDVTTVKEEAGNLSVTLFYGEVSVALLTKIDTLSQTLDALIASRAAADAERQRLEDEKLMGSLNGSVKEATSPIGSVSLTLSGTTTSKTTSSVSGGYAFRVRAGTYTLTASKSGYNTYRQTGVVVTAGQTLSQDISLTKASSSPPPPSDGGDSNGESSYQSLVVSTNRGSFSTLVAKFNLASGQFKVITDTANDDDCADGCATKSLGSFVSGVGGFAGINGTYFCPADYSSCAGQTNSFFWKVFNSRLNKMINNANGLGEYDPFIAFNSSGQARYFSSWDAHRGSGFEITAGINCKPALISSGNNILNEGSLDDKQRSTKSNRGAIGLNGQILYLVIAKSATVIDLASVMDSLDVSYAFNIDGGGSSAMIYNGSYKAGPGRGLPNALIVARR